MIQVEFDSLPEKEQLFNMLLNCDYQRFSNWPGVYVQGVASNLFDDICNYKQSSGRLITANAGNQLLALLIFSDMIWDSKHYEFPCRCVHHILSDNRLDQNLINLALDQMLCSFNKISLDEKIKFVSADLGSWDFNKSFALQKLGFRYVLTQIDGFVKDKIHFDSKDDDVEVGIINPDEIDFFEKLSKRSYFLGGRFYADSGFDRGKVNQMYALLVRNSYENGQILLSYRIKGQPVGLFISKRIETYPHLGGVRVAPLRFLIVDPMFRGKNIARDLFIRTVNFLRERSDLITTGLEVHNIPSLNLHVKLSYYFNYTHNAYHWWNRAV